MWPVTMPVPITLGKGLVTGYNDSDRVTYNDSSYKP